jgi:hypothetical protein
MRGRTHRAATLLGACALLACACASARATITPDAQAVVERHLAAIGGRAAIEASRTTYTKMTIEAFGFSGHAEQWTSAPDRDVSVAELGPFRIQGGFDGTRGWRLDSSGQVLEQDGQDLIDARASTWFANDGWLLPEQAGGRVTRVGTETDSTGTYDVLELTPPVGRARRVYLDTTTHLLVRTVAVGDVMTTITTNTAWRSIAGRVVPTRSVQAVLGAPANTVTQTVDTMMVGLEIPASRFAPPGETPIAVTWLKRDGLARLPFEYRGRHVWVRASLDGRPPADFLVDTGASMTVIDSAYAASIGLQPEGAMTGQGAGAGGSVSFTRLRTLRIEGPDGDGVELADVKAGVVAVNAMLAPFFWRDCAGVLGFNVLNRFVDRIDYAAGVLTLEEPSTFVYRGRGAKVPFRLAGFMPAVTMTLDGRYTGEFRIDVGSSSTVDLHTPFVREHRLLEAPGPSIEVLGGGFGGTFTSRLVRRSSLTLGPFTWPGPLVSLQTGNAGVLASEDYAGNVGNQILDRFTVTFDYERRVMWLEPTRGVKRRDAFSRLGAQLMRMDGVVKVGQVLDGSPAARAGLRLFDEVVAIDGRPALEFGPNAVARMFEERKAGTRVTFDVRRDGALVKLTAVLKDIL